MTLDQNFSPFTYSHPNQYLADVHVKYREINPNFSVRSWAKALGYKSPSYLTEVLNNQKPVSLDLVTRVSRHLRLEFRERKYLELCVLRDNASGQTKAIFQELMDNLQPDPHSQIEADEFRLVADWYHLVILEMLEIADFHSNGEEMAHRLGPPLTPATVKSALERLERLKFIAIDKDGLVKRTSQPVIVSSKVPNTHIRNFHRSMLHKALEALDEQNIKERFFSGLTVPVQSSEISKVEGLVEKFHKDLNRVLRSGRIPDTVYQICTQVFKVISQQPGGKADENESSCH